MFKIGNKAGYLLPLVLLMQLALSMVFNFFMRSQYLASSLILHQQLYQQYQAKNYQLLQADQTYDWRCQCPQLAMEQLSTKQWQNLTCSRDTALSNIHYCWQYLGLSDYAYVGNSTDAKAADYYRLMIFIAATKHYASALYQRDYVKRSQTSLHVSGNAYRVTTGWQPLIKLSAELTYQQKLTSIDPLRFKESTHG